MASPSLSAAALPSALESSVEEAIAQLCQPTAAASSQDVVSSTIRSIHNLLRSTSSASVYPISSPPSSVNPPASVDAFTGAVASLFQSLLLSRHHAQALSLLSLLPSSPSSSPASSALVDLRSDLLRRLVLGLSQSSSIPLLTSLPFGASLGQVKHVLYQQAQHSDLTLSDHSSAPSSTSSSRYYDLLYAVLLAHSDQPLIARSQYQLALRIEAEADLSHPHTLALHIHSLQRAYNALALCADTAVSVRHGSSTSVVSLAQLRQRLQVAVAKLDLLTADTPRTLGLPSDAPTALIQPLLDHDLLDRAVSLATALESQEQRQAAFATVVSHLVRLLSREVAAGEHAELRVEDHREVAATADGYFPPPSPSPTLHCLRALLSHFDDSTYSLRSLALSLLLSSPLSLTIPPWLLSHHPIATAYDSSHLSDTSPPSSPPQPDAFVAVARTLLKANRLDLAVEVAVGWLEERGRDGEEGRGGVGGGRRQKSESGTEWNVLEDLVRRLQQARKISGLDAKTSSLVTGLHSSLMKALG